MPLYHCSQQSCNNCAYKTYLVIFSSNVEITFTKKAFIVRRRVDKSEVHWRECRTASLLKFAAHARATLLQLLFSNLFVFSGAFRRERENSRSGAAPACGCWKRQTEKPRVGNHQIVTTYKKVVTACKIGMNNCKWMAQRHQRLPTGETCSHDILDVSLPHPAYPEATAIALRTSFRLNSTLTKGKKQSTGRRGHSGECRNLSPHETLSFCIRFSSLKFIAEDVQK